MRISTTFVLIVALFFSTSLLVGNNFPTPEKMLMETVFLNGEDQQISGCEGTLLSTDHPANYPNSVSSSIQITADDGGPVLLTVQEFELEGCCDFLRAYDGEDATATLIGEWNGTDLLPNDLIQSTGPVMFLRFTSDGSVTRPGFIIDWQCANTSVAPPTVIADSDVDITCDGVVNFTDLSTQGPTSWTWDFGDGNTSTEQNPTHTYVDNGTFDVSLTACNDLGCNTEIFTEFILVDLSGLACEVTMFEDGEDLTISGCGGSIISTNFPENYPNSVTSSIQITADDGGPVLLTVREFELEGCCDFLRVYDGPDASAALIGEWNGTDLLPNDLIQSTGPVMFLRFTSDGSVGRPGFEIDWQCANTAIAPPTVIYESDVDVSCDGVVNFTDLSTQGPTSWEWDFGDGNTSTEQNPTHTYTDNGTFNVSLTACNDLGCNTEVFPAAITVDLTGLACEVIVFEDGESQNISGCGGAILSTNFPENYPNSVSSDIQITGDDGGPILLTVQSFELEGCCDFLRVYDGADDNAPLIGEWNGTDLLPGELILSTGPTMFLRFTSDGSVGRPGFEIDWQCANTAIAPPAIIIDAESTVSCDGVVNFLDQSTQGPTSWNWEFGDGGTSTEQNPTHVYESDGNYDVSLTACNELGCNTLTFEAFVIIDFSGDACQILVFEDDEDQSIAGCGGRILSTNYPGDYPNNINSTIVISSANEGPLKLIVNDFDLGTCCDFLRVYDGPDNTAPLIGEYSTTDLEAGDEVESTSNRMFLEFTTSGFGEAPGFDISWQCVNDISFVELVAEPEMFCPSTIIFKPGFGLGIYDYAWDFGDGFTATGEGPHFHTYPATGTYQTTLVASYQGDTVFLQEEVTINVLSLFLQIVGPDTISPGTSVTWTKNGSDLLETFDWIETNGAVGTGESFTVDYPEEGTFQVRLDATSSKICDAATIKEVTVLLDTGTKDQRASANSGIVVYPNPVGSELQFLLQDWSRGAYEYRIVDQLGRSLQSGRVEAVGDLATKARIDISRLSAAPYVLEIISLQGQRIAATRFVKR